MRAYCECHDALESARALLDRALRERAGQIIDRQQVAVTCELCHTKYTLTWRRVRRERGER